MDYIMTRERLNGLLDAGLHTATVSLDGFATDHNWMRATRKVLNGLLKRSS